MFLLMAICEEIRFAIKIDKRMERNHSGKLSNRPNLASEETELFSCYLSWCFRGGCSPSLDTKETARNVYEQSVIIIDKLK